MEPALRMYAPVETMVSAVDAMVARERVNEEPVCSDISYRRSLSSPPRNVLKATTERPRPRAPLFSFDAAMETRSKRRKTEPVADKIRRGEISVVVAIAEELPDLFSAEILPKLDVISTLNLAQVSKWCRDVVWSVGGVRSLKAKMEAKFKAAYPGYSMLFSDLLYMMAFYDNVPAVRALLKSGVDVNVSSHDSTPLHCAAEHGRMPVVKVLIEAGADVDKKAYRDQTPLHKAAIRGQAPVIRELIKAGADVNATAEDGNAPLHYAVACNEKACVAALLLAHGVDVRKADHAGTTPMTLAVYLERKKMIKMLKQAGG